MTVAAAEQSLRSVGLVQACESGVRVSVSVIFRLLMGYMAGLPPTAISVNAALAYGLAAVLEVPAGVIADRYGSWRAVKWGYLAQAAAALSLFGGIMAWPHAPWLMWVGIVTEAVLDAFGNSLLSGAREVVLKRAVTAAYADAGGEDLGIKTRLEKEFLARSEAFGRVFLLVLPAIYLGLTLSLPTEQVPWVLVLLAGGWVFLLGRTTALVKRYGLDGADARSPQPWQTVLMTAWRSIKAFAPAAQMAAVSFVGFTFAFGVIHGYLILGLLRDAGSWFAGQMWMSVFVANFAFIGGRLARSFVMPAIVKHWTGRSVTVIGAIAAAALAVAFWVVHDTQPANVTLIGLLVFAAAFDNAIGLATRPALGEVLAAADPQAAASVLSILSQVATVLGAGFALALTATGQGVPTVTTCILTVVAASSVVMIFHLRGGARG